MASVRGLLLVGLSCNLMACSLQGIPQPPTLEPASLIETSEPSEAESPNSQPSTIISVNPETIPDATTFPDPEGYTWRTVASGLQRPVDIQHAGDGSGRLFILEKVGRIRILQDQQLLPVPFLDISDRVGSTGNEQGLLGLAFHPEYTENGRFFLNYTDRDGNTVLARYQRTAASVSADPSSELIVLRVDQPFPNHNGGGLAFGPDGYLYAGLGDGGSAGDPFDNGQNPASLLGAILRLDVDSVEPYAVPADNPFGNEIWAYGLRNPWRISFDRSTGDLYIGDVGQNQWEEVDFVAAGTPGGLNFGWKYYEGTHAYSGTPPQDLQLTPPIVEYDHSQGCSVTGGYVYRGTMLEWNGIYLYGDYCTQTVWGLFRLEGGWQVQVLFGAGGSITSFGQDQAGEVYIATDDGRILRLESH